MEQLRPVVVAGCPIWKSKPDWTRPLNTSCIKAPMKDSAHLPVDQAEHDNVMQHNCQLLSDRQTAEWGMHTMQGSFGSNFGWLHIPLAINDSDICSDILESTSQLFNLQLATTKFEQCIC
jgi:hypothetical protein